MAVLLPFRLDLLQKEVDAHRHTAAQIKEHLEYADGPAYYQDKQRMNQHLEKAYEFQRIINYIREKFEEEAQQQ